MSEVSTFRLYLLRSLYLLIAIGLALMIWPRFLAPSLPTPHMASVVRSVLTAVSLLSLLGLRYPLKMLPVLFFEIVWKLIWVLAFGLPLWRSGQLTPATSESLHACLMGLVLVPLAVPWDYVIRHYVKAGGDSWRWNGPGGP
ncbi:MAG: hypothetical protein FD129_1477 [bacterium]|nr:MAG: hypothetical protein FD129_1477 [bacterium]